MIRCKFYREDTNHAMLPLIFRAFDEYCMELASGDPTLLSEVKTALRQVLGSNAVALREVIPNLSSIVTDMQDSISNSVNEGKQEMNRIVYHLRDFVRAIASPAHPIIMVFDDLQWADEQCFDIISKLITDAESNCILFIGAYRDNEVAPQLEICLGGIAMTARVPMCTLNLGDLDAESVNELVSDALRLSPRLTRALSGVLRMKTGGNPMFVKQLMKVLHEENLLYYSASARRWEYKLEAIREKSVADNTVDLLVHKMKSQYDPESQWILRVASLLGSSFDAATVKLLYSCNSEDEIEVFRHLEATIKDGLIIQTGSTYRFSHDQVFLAAYALTTPSERKQMHLQSEYSRI